MATNRNEPLFALFPINKFPLIRIWNITSLSRRGRTIFFRVFHDNNTFTEYEWRQMDDEWGFYDSDNEIYAGSNEYFLSLSKAMSFLMEGRNGSEMVREAAERSERIQISDNRSIKKVNRSNRFIYK